MKKKAIYTSDGVPAKLSDVRRQAQDAMLKEALGEYISSREAHRVDMRHSTLPMWRSSGKLRSKRVKTTWYYSRQDLLELIRTSKV